MPWPQKIRTRMSEARSRWAIVRGSPMCPSPRPVQSFSLCIASDLGSGAHSQRFARRRLRTAAKTGVPGASNRVPA